MDVIKIEEISDLIVELDGQKVLVDKDVPMLYGIETKRINEAVKNNSDKFPSDYMRETSDAEFAKDRTNPKVFTEKGLYMLAIWW